MQIFYEGVDIFSETSLNMCIHDMYAEQMADTVLLRFNDTKHLWDSWAPAKEEHISVVLGHGKTGDMVIESIKPVNSLIEIRASSIPTNANDKSNKAWQNVKFSQLCAEIAAKKGLTLEMYGVADQTYAYVCQANKEDFVFLSERCVLEGCAFLVYDGKLVVYSEQYLEEQTPAETLIIDRNVKFDYKNNANEIYGSCILKNSQLSGRYAVLGTTGRALEKTFNGKITSQAEADRFAKNLLRHHNKKMRTGICYSSTYLPQYAAGSMVDLETAGVPSWNGPAFLHHVRHDYVKAETKLFFRKPLEGY